MSHPTDKAAWHNGYAAGRKEAAAEIERLQAENKELRAKLDKANEPLWPRTELKDNV